MSEKRVRIEQFEQELFVKPGDTILTAALTAGLDYPFMCQQGQCGACKSQLIEGDVELGNIYNPLVLTDQERARGQILACQAEPRSDCIISVGGFAGLVSHTVRNFACVVDEITRPAVGVTIIRLRKPSHVPFHFSAGQYAQLTFADHPPRNYSMANRPDQDILEFHVRNMPDGRVSNYVTNGLSTGDEVQLRGPFGTAYLREEHLGPILLGAAGTGLAPIQSIVETALTTGLAQKMHLYVGARSAQTLYHEHRLAELQREHSNLRVTFALSESPPNGQYRNGNLNDVIAKDFTDFGDFHVYLAGPAAFCDATQRMLFDTGLSPDSCFTDPFT